MAYSLYTSPVGFDFISMSRAEAMQYFDHYIEQIPDRIRLLQREIRSSSGFEAWTADSGEVSIAGLGVWLAEVAEPRELTEEDKAAMRASTEGPLRQVVEQIYPVDMSARTYSYCMDAGMYFAETLRKRQPELAWKIGPKPKRGLSYNRPVVATPDNLYSLEPFWRISAQLLTFVQFGHKFDLLASLHNAEYKIRKRR
jgi:hypothetical protein